MHARVVDREALAWFDQGVVSQPAHRQRTCVCAYVCVRVHVCVRVRVCESKSESERGGGSL